MAKGLARLNAIDSRWLYAGMLLLLIIPFVVPIPIPASKAAPTTRGVFQTLDSCPADKVVVIDSSWDPGSAAENQAQLECLVRHLCQKRIKFVVTSVGVTPFGPEFARKTITPIAEENRCVYGEDWVNAGYIQSAAGSIGVIIQKLCHDFQAVYSTDADGTKMSALPLMQHVRDSHDIHAIACITYAPSEDWISFVSQFKVPVAFCCMTIMGPYYYRYWDSHQLAGILIGNSGAGEYENMLGFRGRGTKLALVQSFGNCAVILAAILGNIGWWAERRQRRARP
jgi:hypothetical protein